uniref:DNA-directed RNA polymerase subunit n=1 Tax=Helianthus annuus TaxID=4232 RepID=A0A251SNX8_HELAN
MLHNKSRARSPCQTGSVFTDARILFTRRRSRPRTTAAAPPPATSVHFSLLPLQFLVRLYLGEIISARLKESNADGLRLSLGFFEDIYIPELLMPEPSEAEPDSENKGQVKWTWLFNDEKYLIDGVDEIRFRVQNIKFPEIPREQKDPKPFAPMEIIRSLVSEGGLGPVSWWVGVVDANKIFCWLCLVDQKNVIFIHLFCKF